MTINYPATPSGIEPEELLAALNALRNGDFAARLSSQGNSGETATDAQIIRVFNELGEMLGVLAPEVRRVAREVGTEGRFGPQAEVPDLRGDWQGMIDDLNTMAANLTNQVRDLANTTKAIASGDFTRKATVGAEGEMLAWKQTLNGMVDQ